MGMKKKTKHKESMPLAKTIVLSQDINVNFRRIYPSLKRKKAPRIGSISKFV